MYSLYNYNWMLKKMNNFNLKVFEVEEIKVSENFDEFTF